MVFHMVKILTNHYDSQQGNHDHRPTKSRVLTMAHAKQGRRGLNRLRSSLGWASLRSKVRNGTWGDARFRVSGDLPGL